MSFRNTFTVGRVDESNGFAESFRRSRGSGL
jgi:hypothetical protein